MAKSVTASTSNWNRRSAVTDAMRERGLGAMEKGYTAAAPMGIAPRRRYGRPSPLRHGTDVRQRTKPARIVHSVANDKITNVGERSKLRLEERALASLVHDD